MTTTTTTVPDWSSVIRDSAIPRTTLNIPPPPRPTKIVSLPAEPAQKPE